MGELANLLCLFVLVAQAVRTRGDSGVSRVVFALATGNMFVWKINRCLKVMETVFVPSTVERLLKRESSLQCTLSE